MGPYKSRDPGDTILTYIISLTCILYIYLYSKNVYLFSFSKTLLLFISYQHHSTNSWTAIYYAIL